MTAQKGSLVLLKIGNGQFSESFTTIGGMRTTKLVLNNQIVDATNKDSGAWRSLLGGAGIRSVVISGNGIFTDSASEEILRSTAFANVVKNYRLTFGHGDVLTGPFQVTSYERAGEHGEEETYALTVLDQAAFAEEIQARASLGTVEQHIQRSDATGIAAFPFWRDRVAIVAAAMSVLTTVVMAGYVYSQYPNLPTVVQLSFPALGGVVRVGDKAELLRIVYLGVGILAVNTLLGIVVHTKERAAGLWLLASSSMLQSVLLAGAVIAFQKS